MRMVAAGLGTISLLVLLAPGGCGSGGGSVPFDQMAAAYAATFCHKLFPCCDAAELATNSATGADEATCQTTVSAEISANLVH